MTYKDKGSYESWPPCIYPSIYLSIHLSIFLSNTPILQKSKLISIYLSITHTCCNRCRSHTPILQHLFAIAVYITHLFCKRKPLYLCITHTYFAIVETDIYLSMYHTPLTHWDLSHTPITHTNHTHLFCNSKNWYLSIYVSHTPYTLRSITHLITHTNHTHLFCNTPILQRTPFCNRCLCHTRLVCKSQNLYLSITHTYFAKAETYIPSCV